VEPVLQEVKGSAYLGAYIVGRGLFGLAEDDADQGADDGAGHGVGEGVVQQVGVCVAQAFGDGAFGGDQTVQALCLRGMRWRASTSR
jgi:hypothetical protein